MNFSLKRLTAYCTSHTTSPSPALYELDRETHLKTLAPQMASGHLQGQLFRFLSYMIRPKSILEIGTFTAYAAICFAEGLQEGGVLHTIEANKELEHIIRKYISKAGYEEKIQVHLGDAKEIIPDLNGPFDLVFIDAGKMDYAYYFDLVLDKVRPGGYILADNVLWSGKVTQKDHDNDTRMMHAFNEKIHLDTRVENILLPIRDGLMVIRKL